MSDLENDLRKLQPGKPPAAWRAEILAKCERSNPAPLEETRTSWRDWLWPSPLAWGALAAMWIALAAFQAATSPPKSRDHQARSAPGEPGFLVARREYQAVLASLR
jgi:hypothetical protein